MKTLMDRLHQAYEKCEERIFFYEHRPYDGAIVQLRDGSIVQRSYLLIRYWMEAKDKLARKINKRSLL